MKTPEEIMLAYDADQEQIAYFSRPIVARMLEEAAAEGARDLARKLILELKTRPPFPDIYKFGSVQTPKISTIVDACSNGFVARLEKETIEPPKVPTLYEQFLEEKKAKAASAEPQDFSELTPKEFIVLNAMNTEPDKKWSPTLLDGLVNTHKPDQQSSRISPLLKMMKEKGFVESVPRGNGENSGNLWKITNKGRIL